MDPHARRPTPTPLTVTGFKRRRSDSPQPPIGEEQSREKNMRTAREIMKTTHVNVPVNGGSTQGSSAGQNVDQSQAHPGHSSVVNVSETGESSTGPTNTGAGSIQYRLTTAQWQEKNQTAVENARARAAQTQHPPSYQEHLYHHYLPAAQHPNQPQQHLPPTQQHNQPQHPLPPAQVSNQPQPRVGIPHSQIHVQGHHRIMPGPLGGPGQPQQLRQQNPQQAYTHIRRYDMPPPPPPAQHPSFPLPQHAVAQASTVFHGQQPIRHANRAPPETSFAGTITQPVLLDEQDEAKPNAPAGESRPTPKRMRYDRDMSENKKAGSKKDGRFDTVVKIIRASAELLESFSRDSEEDEEK